MERIEISEQSADAIRAMLLGAIQGELEAGFPNLRRVPSTHALKDLRYFNSLDVESVGAFCACLAESAFDYLFPKCELLPLYKRNAAYRRYVDTVGGTAYLSLRDLRNYLAAARRGKVLPPKLHERAEAIIPVTAAELRKRVKITLSDLIRPMKVVREGQYWLYIGDYQGSNISVTIYYSSPHYQLDYWVTIDNTRPDHFGSNFERLLGLNYAQWDNIDQRNAAAVVQLLTEHIQYCADLLKRLREYL